MDLKTLDYFVHVADLRFTKAASMLSIAQSALSHQVRQLEKELDQLMGAAPRRRMPAVSCKNPNSSALVQ